MDSDIPNIEALDIEENAYTNANANPKSTKSKARKRKDYLFDDDGPTEARQKLAKRILYSLTRPSYVLALGPKPLRFENRMRLRFLLRRLVKQHDWVAASGVLSAYLKGTLKDRSPLRNRFKFWALLELLKHVGNHINSTRIKNLYDIWMKKNGSMKTWPVESRYAVHLEFMLYCLMEDNAEDARQLALCLEQEKVDIDPASKIMMGLTFYELWYSSIPEKFRWRDSDQFDTHENSQTGGASFNNKVGHSAWHNTDESHMPDSHYQCDSDASVMNDKHIHRDVSIHEAIEDFMEVDGNCKREEPAQNFQPEGSYLKSEEHEEVGGPFSNYGCLTQDALYALWGLDPWLLPLHLPNMNSFEEFIYMHRKQLNDYNKNAVKYLQLTLNSTHLASAALLPLIQLLLIHGQVQEALNKVGEQCCNSASVLPLRIRAALLECFDRKNIVLLVSCFEDILKKDPTCCHSLAKLIKIHENGEYSLESLLEMIALHLDATDAGYNTWKVFASCFFKLSHCEEDCTSACFNKNEYGHGQHYNSFSKTPKIFTEGISIKSWRLRCRWWLTRHFSNNKLESDIEAGDLQLLTCKAACAAHMYGQEFNFVAKAYSHLEKENDQDLLSFLDEHKRNSFGFYQQFQRKLHNIIVYS